MDGLAPAAPQAWEAFGQQLDEIEAAYRRYLRSLGIELAAAAPVAPLGLLAWLNAGGDTGDVQPDAVEVGA